ncbi:uncharacterized protein LOC120272475 [Dioscorea cayenensis subsp. rotundata]|uniref:Uncharacterized protein LOC120272475 n=1 Tax=Dioscorea cayennensis subsp. rotundata TaxID=55577 RepID=A0AB40C8X1_DIOCR|nr:uncharacterized protein LOC120272475 [Dioscorea cayenensis subsp. rotundata]
MAATTTTLGLLNCLPSLPKLPRPSPSPLIKLPSQPSLSPPLLSSLHHEISAKSRHLVTTSAALSLPLLLSAQDALAADGEFGILEGRSLALIHPIVMSGLFLYTLWAGYLGWQWRRVRTIQNEINELKQQVKPPAPAAVTAGAQSAAASPPPPASLSPIESQIQKLTEERKELIKGSFRDRHFNAGATLLGFGVFEAVAGCVNTYLRTGKLFPGPHLFAGAGITVLWAAAASLVPAMQRGDETARNLHIALNTLNLLLFIWQIPTGIEIIFAVFEYTNWP